MLLFIRFLVGEMNVVNQRNSFWMVEVVIVRLWIIRRIWFV